MQLDFATSQTTWLGSIIPFHPRDYFTNKLKLNLILEHESVHSKITESYSATHVMVKEAIYDMHSPITVTYTTDSPFGSTM
jgi:hypothetical protein